MKKTYHLKRILVIILLLAMAGGLAVAIPWGQRVYNNTMALQAMAVEARVLKAEGLKVENMPDALNLAERASVTIGALRTDIGPHFPFLRHLGPLPRYGPYFIVLEPGLDYIDSLTQAAVLLGKAALPLVNHPSAGVPTGEPSLSSLEKMVALLAEQQPNLDKAEAFLQHAAIAGAQIDPAVVPQRYRPDFEQLNALLDQAPSAFQAVRTLAPLLGSPRPRTYLLLVQNRDELRPSGGFISAFGLLRLDAGHISMLKIEDSNFFNIVREARRPPEPIEKIMLASYLVARDANWSPDFPTAARQVHDVYALPHDVPKDGVIAFDQGFIVRLLAFLGPIQITDEIEPITAANVETRMIATKQAAIAAGNYNERKDFLSVLAPYFIQKLYAINSTARQVDLARLLVEAIREGHLLIYFNDPAPQELLHQAGLDGSVNPAGKGDFLMLVDSNLGISKVDLFIRRSLRYELDLKNPSTPSAVLRLHYQHTRPGIEPCHMGVSHDNTDTDRYSYYFSRCYWDYWRVLAAGGVVLQGSELDPVPPEYFGDHPAWPDGIESTLNEGNTQMFAGLLVVPQAKEREVTLRLQLPPTVLSRDGDAWVYHLRIQKQAGIESLPVEIRVTMPSGTALSDLPDGWTYLAEQSMLVWRGGVTRITDFELKFIPESQISATGEKQ